VSSLLHALKPSTRGILGDDYVLIRPPVTAAVWAPWWRMASESLADRMDAEPIPVATSNLLGTGWKRRLAQLQRLGVEEEIVLQRSSIDSG
jgi:hypothetical protein